MISFIDYCINNAITRSKKGEIGFQDAGTEQRGGARNPYERRRETSEQLVDIIGPSVREASLGQAPHAFVRVELGRIGRKVFEVQAGELATEVADRIALVNPALVPEHDDGAPQVAEEMAEELEGVRVREVLLDEEVPGEAEPSADWTHRNAGDDRDLVPLIPVTDDRRLAAGRPRLVDARDQQESRLVDEDEMGAQPPGVFFTRGHSTCVQCSIAASSRSTARVSGF